MLRPGNAAANSVADQLAVLDEAISGLPAEISLGHGVGDDPGLVGTAVRVRADSAAGTARMARAFRARNVGLAVVARSNTAVTIAVGAAIGQAQRWAPALTQTGEEWDPRQAQRQQLHITEDFTLDEKTGIQAKERIAATTPTGPGRPARYEFEYRRHGTASLLAAMDVHSGEVLATDIARKDSVTFIGFSEDIDANVAPSLEIHLVIGQRFVPHVQGDQGLAGRPSSFRGATQAQARHWVNMVGLFFSIVTRKVLKRGDFASGLIWSRS